MKVRERLNEFCDHFSGERIAVARAIENDGSAGRLFFLSEHGCKR